MMRNSVKRRLALGALAAAVASTPAFAQTSQTSEEWQYREEAESCRAYRWFGTGEDRSGLQLRSFGPGSAVEVMLINPQLPKETASARYVELSWGGQDFEDTQVGILGSVGGVPSVTMLTRHRPTSTWAFFYNERAVVASTLDPAAETMKLRVVGDTPKELQMGSLQEPLRRLMDCESNLIVKWGWGRDWDYSQRFATHPEPRDPQQWFFKAIVYPAVQNLARVSSFLQLRLKVDAKGKVAECVVQSSPGSSLFGSKNCERISNMGRFKPALDSQGQAIEGYMQMSITFARYD